MIHYVLGDATAPGVDGNLIVAHVCNDIGGWGRGFVLSVTKKWPAAERSYRDWHQMNPTFGVPEVTPFRLGRMKLVRVENRVWVANMIAQHGVLHKDDGTPPIRYGSLEDCLAELHLHARELEATIHMPRIGCGLAGGKWSEIEQIIERQLTHDDVYVYDFDTGDARTVPWSK